MQWKTFTIHLTRLRLSNMMVTKDESTCTAGRKPPLHTAHICPHIVYFYKNDRTVFFCLVILSKLFTYFFIESLDGRYYQW